MKLIYISPLRYPSEKAGSQFSMQSCEAFADQGVEVELWAPRRWNQFGGEDPFLFHRVKKNFRITKMPALDLSPVLPVFFFLLSFSFAVAVFFYALFRGGKDIVYYSHEPFALLLLTFLRGRTVYEIHDFPGRNILFRWLFRRLDAVVTTNHWKKREIIKRFSFDAGRIFVVFNAVDADMFAIDISRRGARTKLNLPHDKKIILYTGHLFGWKGVDTFLAVHRFLGPDEVIYFVGGTDEDIEMFKVKSQKLPPSPRWSYGEAGRQIHGLRPSETKQFVSDSKVKSIVIVGRRPHEEIPLWLRAADVLVLPNTAREDISKYYTSPVKLFEYMASGTPVVASDLPSIREIVSEKEVCFVTPDDPEALYGGIKKILSRTSFASEISKNAAARSRDHTWSGRAENILLWLKLKS